MTAAEMPTTKHKEKEKAPREFAHAYAPLSSIRTDILHAPQRRCACGWIPRSRTPTRNMRAPADAAGQDGIAQDILDELRILVCFFRDIFLIRTLEQRIDGRGSLLLKKHRQFLDVDARHAFTISEPHACYGTLVMRPIRRYLLLHGQSEVNGMASPSSNCIDAPRCLRPVKDASTSSRETRR